LLAIYASTLMVSALLLFLVQPMFAKMVLPSLGGTPAVWNTCMVFFQAMLLGGYAYAHLGTKFLTPKRQAGVHVVLLAVSLIALPIAPRYVDPGTAAPIPWLIGLLFVSLGVPFFMLSASAPLLQRWFAASGHAHARDPYFLYGASNLGSLAALIGYPLLMEPLLRLGQQSTLWSIGYELLVVLIAISAWMLKRAVGNQPAAAAPDAVALDDAPVTNTRRLHWIALAFVPSSLLLGVTTYITTDLAAVPLLWVVPLAIYLLTFVIVFARRPLLKHPWMVRAQPFLLLPVVMLLLWNQKTMVWLMAPLHLLLFFACAMVCHGELAKDRPAARHLTEFYLWMSFGGVLGGMFNALVAPVVFSNVHEYPIAVALACMLRPYLETKPAGPRAWIVDLALPGILALGLCIYAVKFAWDGSGPTPVTMMIVSIAVGLLIYACRLRPLRFGLAVGAVLLAGTLSADGPVPVLLAERSFFGVHKISLDEEGAYKLLTHGTTIHGAQATDPEDAKQPLTYYHYEGPLGQIAQMLDTRLQGKRIGAVGLGSGAVSCYADPGIRLTFFEIDPVVVAFASDPKYFSYVSECGATRPDFVVGDARLTLAREPDGAFSLLILDAFSSDAIPLHLVTKEAMQLYLAKLAPDGVIAFHISNRYLDLSPVLAAIIRELGLVARISDESDLDEEEGRANLRYPATWVAIARKPEELGQLWTAGNWTELQERQGIGAWTDDFSNILSVLTIRTKDD